MNPERRSAIRMLCADMIAIRWKDRSGTARKAMALLEDISSSGACLQLETPVPVGIEIEWESPAQSFAGRVRYCMYKEIGYFIGVEFTESSRWSPRTYQPQHMLDPQSLTSATKDRRTERPS